MSSIPPPRRPARLVAAATLVLLHLAAIDVLLTYKGSRERSPIEVFTQLFTVRPKQVLSNSDHPLPLPKPRQPPPATIAPLPVLVARTERTPDSSTAITSTTAGPSPSAQPASGAASAGRLDLAIPKDFYDHPPPLTPAQEAMLDPRSNRLVLTKQEQLDIDFGVVECIAWQRQPDGSIYRGPGHLQYVPGLQVNPFSKKRDRLKECVK